ncbi:hypothetical protein [Bacillus infantis]|uniref:hypothetical protein n=1 Tax=Bacillus infantis TaxID=324767 RepID=UPI003CF09AF9
MAKRLILLSLLSAVLFVLISSFDFDAKKTNANVEEKKDYVSFEYKITKVEEGTYYGKSADGLGISFTLDDLDQNIIIKKEDTVVCYFEKDNMRDGLVRVEKK